VQVAGKKEKQGRENQIIILSWSGGGGVFIFFSKIKYDIYVAHNHHSYIYIYIYIYIYNFIFFLAVYQCIFLNDMHFLFFILQKHLLSEQH